MTRILFVYHVSSIGGGSYCLLNLLRAIDRNVFAPVVLLPQEGPLCDEIARLGIDIVYFPPLALYPYNKSIFRISTLIRIKKVIACKNSFSKVLRSIHPDITYFNSMMLFPFLKLAKENGSLTVLHVREHWPLNEHKLQLKRAQKSVYNYADKVIAINRYSASIFPNKQSTIVYDWIDMESRRGGLSLKEIVKDKPRPQKVYIFTGGLQKIKGTLEVIKVFTQCIKGDSRRLIVLGVEPHMEWKGLKGKVKKILSKLGYKTYRERVINLCKQDDRIICTASSYNITDLLECVDGVVSFFTIPHANLALAESIILKVPMVAALSDESLEYSNEGQLALLYKLGDIKAFKNAWMQLDSDDQQIKQSLASQSYLVAERFDAKINAGYFNETLKEMVG